MQVRPGDAMHSFFDAPSHVVSRHRHDVAAVEADEMDEAVGLADGKRSLLGDEVIGCGAWIVRGFDLCDAVCEAAVRGGRRP